jgi:subtilase family serine protease
MHLQKFSCRIATASLVALAALATHSLAAEAAHNVAPSVRLASDRGAIDTAQPLTITVHLKMQNEAAFQKAVDALYDPASPTFHKWMTDEQIKTYAPSQDKVEAVQKELESHGLTILSVDKNGLSIRARGAAGQVEAAFGTQLHEFESNGRVFRANVQDAKLAGAAGEYVKTVSGLESHTVTPNAKRAINIKTKQPLAGIPLSKVKASGGLSQFIVGEALSAPESFLFTTPGAQLPVATYYGNVYGINPNLEIAFTPQQLQTIYSLPKAYAAGLDGTGQTIVLLEGYGYPTMEADANALFSVTGLPLLSSSNFSVIYPQGQPVDPNAGIDTGWNVEIALDIQSAHSIAPKAKIVVVAAAGQDNESFQDAMLYIVNNKIGYAVSDSWEEDTDLFAGPLEDESYDTILAQAAAKGVSFQFSTGDSGDNGLGTPVGAAGVPSNSPHATAVGGTTVLANGVSFKTLGWGDNFVGLNADGPLDPPQNGGTLDGFPLGFFGGAGGGESVFFAKPSWQKALPGTGRQTPDVSALADPQTGFPIIVTEGGNQFLFVYGGTSLASPIFTAIWAIADQNAGHPLGQAAPTIAQLPVGKIADVQAVTSPGNIYGSIVDASGSTSYTSDDIFGYLVEQTTAYTDAIWPLEQGLDVAASFGMDTSLTVNPGWDNVTGYGTPAGLTFLNAVAGK